MKKKPAILFDTYAVYKALSVQARRRTSSDNVSDVLDALVKIWHSYKPDVPAR